MATKQHDSFEEFQRKQATKRAAELPPTSHNEPQDLPSLSHEEHTYVDLAREALATMKRTFEFWMVIARGLRTLKDKADRIGGRFTFDRLREREGLGGKRRDGTDILNKTRVSRLLAILDDLSEVEKWRAEKLTDKQRFDWASLEAVFRHCPVFAEPKSDEPKPPSKAKQTSEALAKALQENHHLKERLKQADGSLFDIKHDTAENIGRAIADNISEAKFKNIVKAATQRYKAKQHPAG
jgi:hypothetical protein